MRWLSTALLVVGTTHAATTTTTTTTAVPVPPRREQSTCSSPSTPHPPTYPHLPTYSHQTASHAPTPTDCTRSTADPAVLDCWYDGELVHVSAAANRTRIQAPGAVVWNDASTGDVQVRAPGFGLTCVTDKAGEQHCHIRTAWWSNNEEVAADTKESKGASTTTTPPNLRRRGLAVAVRNDGGPETVVAGPLTDVQEDCRELPDGQGRNCTVNGRWAHVQTDNATTQVLAPGVAVNTVHETGDVNVDAWGIHVVCRKNKETGKTKCKTSSDWFKGNNRHPEQEGEWSSGLKPQQPPTTTTVEAQEPDPVMHLHPTLPAQQQQQDAGARGPSPGYSPAVQPTEEPLDPAFGVDAPVEPIDPGMTLVDPIDPGFGVDAPVPRPMPAERVPTPYTTPSEAVYPLPSIAIDPPVDVAEVEVEEKERAAAPMFGEPLGNKATVAAVAAAAGPEQAFAGVNVDVVAPSVSVAAAPATPDPRDPNWLTNPKNCTRAANGEGKDCWVEGHWVHVRAGATDPVPATAAQEPPASMTAVSSPNVEIQVDDTTGDIEVQAPGVRVVCHRAAGSKEAKCQTTPARVADQKTVAEEEANGALRRRRQLQEQGEEGGKADEDWENGDDPNDVDTPDGDGDRRRQL